MLSMFCGNAVAKEADVPVNMLFSRNVEIVKASEVTECSADEMMLDEDSQNRDSISKEGFVEFTPYNTEDTTYEIIYNGKAVDVSEQGQIDPQHFHNLVDTTIKEHKKKSDGSCVTTYYEGQKCTSCGRLWKGDVINVVTMAKCTH